MTTILELEIFILIIAAIYVILSLNAIKRNLYIIRVSADSIEDDVQQIDQRVSHYVGLTRKKIEERN